MYNLKSIDSDKTRHNLDHLLNLIQENEYKKEDLFSKDELIVKISNDINCDLKEAERLLSYLFRFSFIKFDMDKGIVLITDRGC